MKRNAFRKGVTLVEVLVASVLLAIVVSASMLSATVYHRITEENVYTDEAMSIIQDRFDKMKAIKTRSNITDTTNTYNSIANAQTIVGVQSDNTSKMYKLYYTTSEEGFPDNADCKVLEVTAHLSWNSGGQNRTVSVATRTNF